MGQLLQVHPDNPQRRLVQQAADSLNRGGLVVYPTDTTYALACHIGDKNALERIVALRRLPKNHQFTLACRDLSELGLYARVDNMAFRLLKHYTPGPFTFILPATREVPKRVLHPKRRTIGIRVPDNPTAQMLLELMGEPMLTTTMSLEDSEYPVVNGSEIFERFEKQVDFVLDAGDCGIEMSTVVDLTDNHAQIVRQGAGVIEL